MQSVDFNAAESRLHELFKAVEDGETVYITRNGKPYVRLELMIDQAPSEMQIGVDIGLEAPHHLDNEIEALFNSLK
ncbi:type II toxin-antitoxin system Phd/YefM family antitoxin [Pseudomonas syringae]|uniref:type II toxin-antitoxin system Phd/YefM family antitoxin n=1 Tax=Pseudomonas syringae TaxID=317 RepID=UPI0004637CAD|nr:type II toxin-antitoxin system Phd/YefM family antitoxin [Pseudomonas syringae]